MRARAVIEDFDEYSERIVVTEIPFMVNKSRLNGADRAARAGQEAD